MSAASQGMTAPTAPLTTLVDSVVAFDPDETQLFGFAYNHYQDPDSRYLTVQEIVEAANLILSLPYSAEAIQNRVCFRFISPYERMIAYRKFLYILDHRGQSPVFAWAALYTPSQLLMMCRVDAVIRYNLTTWPPAQLSHLDLPAYAVDEDYSSDHLFHTSDISDAQFDAPHDECDSD